MAPRHRVVSENLFGWLVEKGRNLTLDDVGRDTEARDGSATATPHPEEMRASVELCIGRLVSIRATARATPAGLAAAAVVMSAILVPVVWLHQIRNDHRLRAGQAD